MTEENATSEAKKDLSHERFIRLFLQSEPQILRYVLSIVPNLDDARDIVQDAAVSLWEKFDEYDPERPFEAWAFRFALNNAKVFLRSQSRRHRFLSEDIVMILGQKRIDTKVELDIRQEYLKHCLEKVPEHKAGLIRAYYFDGASIESLAQKFSRNTQAIYKTIQRIRVALHRCIDSQIALEGKV